MEGANALACLVADSEVAAIIIIINATVMAMLIVGLIVSNFVMISLPSRSDAAPSWFDFSVLYVE